MTNLNMPLISAVTPCLNDAYYLPEMIESFLAQDYPNKELIVQDGGSTDGTHEILRSYPVRWNVAHDLGPHDAINKAILASQGELVVIMPANDLFAPQAFARAAEALCSKPETAMIYGDYRIMDENGATIRIDRPGTLDIDRLLWGSFLALQSSYIRRGAFDRVGYFEPSIKGPGDTEWLFRMVAGYPSESFCYVPEVLSSFRLGHSLKRVNTANFEQSARVLFNAHEKFLSSAENCSRLRLGVARARAGMHCQCASWLSASGRRGEAASNFWQAFRDWPGLLLTAVGLKYLVRVLLGWKLTQLVTRVMFSFRAAFHVRESTTE